MVSVQVDLQPMNEGELEYILNTTPISDLPKTRFQVISDEEARELYFPVKEGKVKVYVVVGGQKGDEGKAKTTALLRRIDPNVKWVMAPNSTHNAGKGVHTLDEEGNPVRLSLHLCPETIVDKDIYNYIGSNTQTNPISLEKEVTGMIEATGRNRLGEDYHLMLDSRANLVVPTNRADDVVNKPNAMGSTISGATSSFKYASAKQAPLVEHVLYDHKQFFKYVNLQIREFNDNIRHDKEFEELGIVDMQSLGTALKDKEKLQKNQRLAALAGKLSDKEIAFFSHETPAQYLLEEYQRVMESGLFYIGDCRKDIHKHIDEGYSGILEGVQSSLLSGGVAYSKNRTAAHTHGMGIIGDAGLTHPAIEYEKTIVLKEGNTSVGGNDRTMSGFIRQDQLSKLTATTPSGENVSFEKTATLEQFLSSEQIKEAFTQVDEAFYEAIKKGYSLKKSTIKIEGIDAELRLVDARALLMAYVLGETGETSKRSRTCRANDRNETDYMRGVEGDAKEVKNALDRIVGMKNTLAVDGYMVAKEGYGDYQVGDIIEPGMSLLQEHLTVDKCVPVLRVLEGSPSLFDDGTNESAVGKFLHPNAATNLHYFHGSNDVLAIGTGKGTTEIYCVKEVA